MASPEVTDQRTAGEGFALVIRLARIAPYKLEYAIGNEKSF